MNVQLYACRGSFVFAININVGLSSVSPGPNHTMKKKIKLLHVEQGSIFNFIHFLLSWGVITSCGITYILENHFDQAFDQQRKTTHLTTCKYGG